ncbi:MAG: ABC transporter ATP-binding protein [Gemmatimonadota bacterium]
MHAPISLVAQGRRGWRGTDEPTPSWRERLAALRYVPALLKLVYESEPRYTVAIIILRIARSGVPVALLWVGKLIIDGVIAAIAAAQAGQPVGWRYLAGLVAVELAIAFGGEVLARFSSLLESLLGDLFSNNVSVRLMRHASTLDLAQFEDAGTYDHLERARRSTVRRIGLLATLLGTLQNLITLVTLTLALLLYVPWLLLLLAIAVIPAFLGETHFAALGYSLLFQWTPERRMLDYLRYVGASDATAKETKLFRLSNFLVGRYAKLAQDFYEANRKLAVRRSLVSTALALLGSLGFYAAYAVIIYLTVISYESPAGVFTIGVLTFLAGSFRQSRNLIQNVLLSLTQTYEQSLYLRDLFTFFDIKPRVVSAPDARPAPRQILQGFVFEGVGFKYPGSDAWALRDISLEFRPGERTALVGENGAGKTTLVKLLARLYDPDEGRILLDGVDLREYELEGLQSIIGVIFQDFVRYELLFRENIAVSEIDALDDGRRVEEAARRSLADGVARRLAGGYEQQIGRRFEGGVELSGGEWQKVALARAYLREAQLLILDEPTAALDARAEFAVFERFSNLTQGKMAVIISHRFSTVRMAQRIVVLNQGELLESGSHEELLAADGLYAELFNLQAAAYR